MGEVEEEQKFVCKLCNKSCSSGRSLGGHMRWHLPSLVAAASKKKDQMKSEINTDCEDHDHYNCGFKENPDFVNEFEDQEPKKPLKMSGLKTKPCNKEGFFCKECGKKFPTSQGVAGHMRIHSKKGKCQAEDFDSMNALIGHMKINSEKIQTLTNTDGLSEFKICYPEKKRSVTSYMINESNSVSSPKESAFNVEIDEDVVNAAAALIMMSMGVRDSDIHANSLEHFNQGITNTDGDDVPLGHVDEQKPRSCLLGCQNSVFDHNLSPNSQALRGHKRAHSTTLQIEDTVQDMKV